MPRQLLQIPRYTGLAPINPAMAIKQTKLNNANANVNFPFPAAGALRSRLSRTSSQNQPSAATVYSTLDASNQVCPNGQPTRCTIHQPVNGMLNSARPINNQMNTCGRCKVRAGAVASPLRRVRQTQIASPSALINSSTVATPCATLRAVNVSIVRFPYRLPISVAAQPRNS
ncbi:hypothetical protein EMIT0194MI4_90237 [Pseudomonas sp. IT-194MI4]